MQKEEKIMESRQIHSLCYIKCYCLFCFLIIRCVEKRKTEKLFVFFFLMELSKKFMSEKNALSIFEHDKSK